MKNKEQKLHGNLSSEGLMLRPVLMTLNPLMINTKIQGFGKCP